jgi:hypothetical protein
MGVYKLSAAGGIATPRTNYSSFLAGNPKATFPSYESIATYTIGSGGSAGVTFSSIPSTYSHLQIRAIVRSSRNNGPSTDNLAIQVGNGGSVDTGANYSEHLLRGSGTAVISDPNPNASNLNYAVSPSTAATGSVFSAHVIDFLEYKNTNIYKTVRWLGGYDTNGGGFVYLASGNWRNTAAITDIKVYFPGWNLLEYSSIALYGIKGS